jgi:membrane protein insertase Oxa1/YidC/SpoIIIJ
MQTGGVLWFSDLTASDPYYILPLTASATMLATLEVGSPKNKERPVGVAPFSVASRPSVACPHDSPSALRVIFR